jgi:hypothetical protein
MDVWQAPNSRLALRCVSERCPNQLCQGVALIPQVPRPLFASGLALGAGRSPVIVCAHAALEGERIN